MLNSTKHKISTAHKKYAEFIKTFHVIKRSNDEFIMLIDVKMPKIVSILTFMSMINFVLSSIEHKILL